MKSPLLLCLLLPLAVHAQSEDKTKYPPPREPHVVPPANGTEAAAPFKGANKVIVRTADSPEIAYKALAKQLLAGGYILEKADKDLMFLTTAPKAATGMTATIIQAVLEPDGTGSKIMLQGLLRTSMGVRMGMLTASSLPDSPIIYGGMKGSPRMVTWDALHAVAIGYQGGRVSFTKQP